MSDFLNALHSRWQMFQILHDLGIAFLDNHGERINIEAKLSEARAAEVAEAEERLKALEGDAEVSLKEGNIFMRPKRVEITSEQIDAVFDAWMRGRMRIASEAQEPPASDETAEKMIPASAIAPLLNVARSMFCLHGEHPRTGGQIWTIKPVDPRLVLAYDVAAKAAGWKTSAEVLVEFLSTEPDPSER